MGTGRVSVVLIDYNTPHLALACVRSMSSLDVPDLEVVFLDNGSRTFDPAPFREARPDIVIHRVEENLGPALGYNRAAGYATGEYLLILNSDTAFPVDNRMQDLVDHLDAHPEYAAAAPLTVDADGVADPWQAGYLPSLPRMVASVPARLLAARFPGLWPLLGRVAVACGPLEDRDVEVTCFAATLVRRSCFEAEGGFSAEYPMYYIDTDLSKRFQVARRPVRWIVGSRVVHHCGGSGGAAAERERRYARAEELYFRKWKSRPALWALRLVRLPFRALPALERWRRRAPVQEPVRAA